MDVRSEVGSGGPGIQCDAISMGVGFTGYRIRYAGMAAGRQLTSACDMADGGVPDGGSMGMSDAGVSPGG